jgi:perosamine synthetase
VNVQAGARQIPLSRPDIGPQEEEYVLAALRSGILGLGPFARNFETEFAAFCGSEHAVSVSSGTAGLHLCVRAAGIGAGDEVVTAPISFVASANVMLFERATPVFADVDPDTFVLDPAAVEAAITPRTRGILPVHVFGYPCDLEALGAIAEKHSLVIIEDACEAVGSERSGRRIGAAGNPAVFAFYPNKQMTTGEGGMVTTDDAALAGQLRSLANQGRSDSGDWLEHDKLGFNYRMDELSAAVGLAQTERLEEILAARAAVAARYDNLLSGIDGVTVPAATGPGDVRSWFVYVVRLDAAIDRNAVMAALQERGVACKPYLPAVHLQPFYRSLGHRPGEFPIAEAIARSTLALPFHTRLAADDQAYVAACLADVLG